MRWLFVSLESDENRWKIMLEKRLKLDKRLCSRIMFNERLCSIKYYARRKQSRTKTIGPSLPGWEGKEKKTLRCKRGVTKRRISVDDVRWKITFDKRLCAMKDGTRWKQMEEHVRGKSTFTERLCLMKADIMFDESR